MGTLGAPGAKSVLATRVSPSKAAWTCSGCEFDIEAKHDVRVLGLTIKCKEGTPAIEVWYAKDVVKAKSLTVPRADAWQLVSRGGYTQGMCHLALAEYVTVAAHSRASFHIWAGGRDIMYYNQLSPGPRDNDDICVHQGLFSNAPSQRWQGLQSSGEFVGEVVYSRTTVDLDKPKMHAGLAQDLSSLYCSESFSDVTIIVGEQRFPAHRALLGARCKVFYAMLNAPMKEAITREIVLKDLEEEAVRQLLRFIYTGGIDSDYLAEDAGALSLMQAAHRFDVPALVDHCARVIGSRLQVDTVAEVLVASDAANLSVLRELCISFLVEHAVEVQSTESFKCLAERCPALMLEVFAAATVPPCKRARPG